MTEQTQTLSLVLRTIRSGLAVTRPELSRHTGLGRTSITQRVDYALKAGLLSEGEPAPSTGGRPSRILRFASGRGAVLGVVFGATHVHLAVADLDGTPLADRRLSWNVERGPEASLAALIDAAGQLLTDDLAGRLWGVCVGVPGPVDFARGRPVQPPIMKGWHDFPLRERLETHFAVPAWVDNDANVMALGAWSQHRSTAGNDALLVKASTGIGLGLISRGRLHRGARGAAGDLGHTIVAAESRLRCRCGKFGCLEALAGGWALARDARAAALAGRSAFLRDRLDDLSVTDVLEGCAHDDEASTELVTRAGELVGAQLALLVSVFNPSTVYLAGTLAQAGDVFRKPVIEQVTRGALPLATDELVITDVDPDRVEGAGAAQLAIDELLHPGMLSQWLPHGSPRNVQAGDRTGAHPLYLA
ncbi:ROK family protein [Streptomyces olivaceus]